MKKIYFLLFILFSWTSIHAAETQFKTKPLSQELKSYIMSRYKAVPNKKLVIYDPVDSPDCPHGQAYVSALKKQRSRTDLKSNYSFQPWIKDSDLRISYSTMEEARAASKKELSFFHACGFLCIISLENNWIYSIGNAVGAKEGNMLSQLFTTFKSRK